MTFTDTHTHLYDEAFAAEEDIVIARAAEAGVTKMVLPDIDSQTREAMFKLASRHEGTLFPCAGLHPTSVGAEWQKEQMMKNAVEGVVIKTDKHTSVRYKSFYGTDRYFYGIADKQFKPDDKVWFSIVKEDER